MSTNPNVLQEFTNVWETAYDLTTTTFDCTVNRTQGDSSTQLYLINHYLDTLFLGQPTPDKTQANVTNGVSGVGSLGQQVQTCAAEYGRDPNYLLVDVSSPFLHFVLCENLMSRDSSTNSVEAPCSKSLRQRMGSLTARPHPLPHPSQAVHRRAARRSHPLRMQLLDYILNGLQR